MPSQKNKKSQSHQAPRQAQRYAPTSWGQNQSATVDLVVPSGQLCLVRVVGIPGLVKAGILHSLDSLTALVDQKFITKGDNGDEKLDVEAVASDPTTVLSLLETIDKVVCHTVIQPPLLPIPEEVWDEELGASIPGEREDGVVYVDTVDENDKMFIFQYVVGGTRDLEQFRHEFAELMASVDDVQDVQVQA